MSEVEEEKQADNKSVKVKQPVFNQSDPIKLSQYLALQPNVSDEDRQQFIQYCQKLVKKKKLSAREKDWQKDYLMNHHLMDRVFLVGENQPVTSAGRNIQSNETTGYDRFDDAQDEPQNDNTYTSLEEGVATIKLNELVRKPKHFNGFKPKPRQWLDDYEKASRDNQWSDYLKVKYFGTFLEDSAYDWWVTLGQSKVGPDPEWLEVRRAFLHHYVGESDQDELQRSLDKMFQKEKEKGTVFIPKVLRLIDMINAAKPESEKVHIIKSKLRSNYQDKLALYTINTVEALNSACLKIESGMVNARNAASRENTKREGRDKKDASEKSNFRGKSTMRGRKSYKSKQGNQSESRSELRPRKCYRCERIGHFASDCRAKSKADGSQCNPRRKKKEETVAAVTNTDQSEPQLVPQSTNEEKVATVRQGGRYICSASQANLLVGGGSLIQKEIAVNKQTVRAIVDTGAFMSVIDSQVASRYKWKLERANVNLVHAAGESLNCLGQVKAEIALTIGKQTKKTTIPIVVVDKLCTEMLLGIEVLRALEVIIRVSSEEPLAFETSKAKGLKVAQRVVLPPRSINLVTGKVKSNADTLMVEAFNFDDSLLVANSVVKNRNEVIDVAVLNTDTKAVELKEGQQIGSITEVTEEVQQDASQLVGGTLPIGSHAEVVQIGDNLNEEQRKQLAELINTYQEAFSINNSLGLTEMMEHEIELLPNTKPFAEPVRRHPRHHLIEAQRQIEEMKSKGIIEESSSPWASEFVLVKKKTGDYRLCIDYRRLNAVTKKNSYPLPNVESCLEALAGKCFFSKLDFASGYWQMPMAKSSKELTSFRTDNGLYQFKVMPFGLVNAPASFQKLINVMFAGLRGMELQVFLDDVCLATNTWERHMELLEKVFQIVIKSKLKLKGSKCYFATSETVFLGHRINRLGIQQDPSKTIAMQKLPEPKNVKDIQRTLGAFGYYRRFVHNFSTIAEPLIRLTRKGQAFYWGEEQRLAFRTLKEQLLKNVTLAHLNANDPVVLKTDASTVGIAGMLLQRHEGEWRIVSCISRRLTPAESNYTTTEVEALAIVYSLQKLRPYLLGRKFKILTDHCALCSMKKKVPNSPRVRRWALLLSEFDYEVEHVSGTAHRDVDCLSRAPVCDEGDRYVEDMPTYAVKTLMDPLWASTYNALRDGLPISPINSITLPKDVREWIRSYNLEDDEEMSGLYDKGITEQDDFKVVDSILYKGDKLVVPKSKRTQLLTEAHDEAGHDGCLGTLQRLNYAWWPQMRKDVDKYVKTCRICQMRKAERVLPSGQMEQHYASRPMELVAFDFLGPLQPTLNNNKFIAVGVDTFTRYAFAKAMLDQTSASFAEFLLECFAWIGIPETILTDNSRTFDNELIRRIESDFGVKHRFCAPRHSRGNAVVERLIETLQEKLSLVTEQHELDWDKAMTKALISINSKQHRATGYSPMELMFVRNMSCKTVETVDNVDVYASYAMQKANEIRADALAKTSDAHNQAKVYFDSRHRNVSFDVGAKVLIKRTSRRSKLSNRFEGPFEVVSRDKDIYKVRSIDNRQERLRHVSQLKAFQEEEEMRIALIALTTVAWVANAEVLLNEESPIFWKEVPEKLVVEGDERGTFELRFASPCELILKFPEPQRLGIPAPQAPSVYGNSVGHKQGQSPVINNAGKEGQQQPQPVPQQAQQLAQAQQPIQPVARSIPSQRHTAQTNTQTLRAKPQILFMQPTLVQTVPHVSRPAQPANAQLGERPEQQQQSAPQNNNIDDKQPLLAGQAVSREEAIRMGLGYLVPGGSEKEPEEVSTESPQEEEKRQLRNSYYDQCERVFQEEITKRIDNFNQGVERRQLGIITGYVVSNIVNMFKERIVSSNQREREANVDRALKALNEKTNLQDLAVKALASTTNLLQDEVTALNGQIKGVADMNIISSYLISKIVNTGNLIDRFFTSVREKNPDMITVAQLYGGVKFDQVELRDTEVSEVTKPMKDAIRITINGKIRSKSTKVYETISLTYFANLTGQAIKMEYNGMKWLIRNETNDCVTGISSNTGKFVETKCSTPKGRDNRLKNWRKLEVNIDRVTKHSESALANDKLIVYCYGNNVTITHGTRINTTTACPTFVFGVPAKYNLKTSDGFVNHVGGEEIANVTTRMIFDVQEVHFDMFEPIHQQFEKSLELVHKLTNQSIVATINGKEVTWQSTAYVAGAGISSLISLAIIICIYVKCKKMKLKKWPQRLQIYNRRAVRSDIEEQVQLKLAQEMRKIKRELEIQARDLPPPPTHKRTRSTRSTRSFNSNYQQSRRYANLRQ